MSVYCYAEESLNASDAWINGSGIDDYCEILSNWGAFYVAEAEDASGRYLMYALETDTQYYIVTVGYSSVEGENYVFVMIMSEDKTPAYGG